MKQSVSGYIFHQILTSVDGGDDGCCVVFCVESLLHEHTIISIAWPLVALIQGGD